MADNESESGQTAEIDSFEAELLVRRLASIVQNTMKSLWFSSADADNAVKECFTGLNDLLEEVPSVEFRLINGILKINAQPVIMKDALMKSLADHMESTGIDNFEFMKGIELEQFAALIAIMVSRDPDLEKPGGLGDMLEKYGVKNIQTRTYIVQEITDDEVIADKEDVIDRETEEKKTKDMISYLTGQEPENQEEMTAVMKDAYSDSRRMADMIVKAAEETAAIEHSDSVSPDAVVNCLQRAFDGLMLDPSMNTPTGKRKLSRALKLMEQEIVTMMGGAAGDFSDDCANAISEAISEMTDDLEVGAMASEYMKKLRAIEQTEKKLLRFIKSIGLDRIEDGKLSDQLNDEGLDVEGWRQLLAKSGLTNPALEGSMGSLAAVGHLASLLDHISDGIDLDALKSGAVSPENTEKLHEHVVEVEREVESMAAGTQQKIKHLVEDISADEETIEKVEKQVAKEGKQLRMSRKRLLEVLAEAVQELCQPLAVISCSLDMITTGSLGEVNPNQTEMLKLATESIQKMSLLADNLRNISGLPEELNPDAEIQASLYQ